MRYQVRFVGDDSLPSEVQWVLARTLGQTYLFVKQSAVDPTTGRCDALSDAWEAWQCAEIEAHRQSLSALTSV